MALQNRPFFLRLCSHVAILLVCAKVTALGAVYPPSVPFSDGAKQIILYDMLTDTVLFEKNAHQEMTPSSMTKVLLVYMAFAKLKNGQASLQDLIRVSSKARYMQGSRMFLELASQVTVEQLLQGVIVHSGNDASVALAEGLYGSEHAAVAAANRLAQELGLRQSHFTNVTGWPDPDHVSTAYDILRLGIQTIRDFPQMYRRFYAQKVLTHNKIKQYNRNPLVHRGLGDGLKTGTTEKGGYGLLGSAKKKGRRLVFVINGLSGDATRARAAFSLLNWGFKNFDTVTLFKKGNVVGRVAVEEGVQKKVSVVAPHDIVVAYPRGLKTRVRIRCVEQTLKAPFKKGDAGGLLQITAPSLPLKTVPLVAGQDVKRLSWVGRQWARLYQAVAGLFVVEEAGVS